MEIEFTTRLFKEGRAYVAHALELDVSSCGGTKEKALKNLKGAVRLFLEEAERMGTLAQILEEAGYSLEAIARASAQVRSSSACSECLSRFR
jgi:predicted RNase H-like HicB family nuclease